MKPIGIIGGGLAGLSAACVLAARGRKVTLFERNAWLGGKAAQLRGDGFRFDMGPTIVTIPSVLRRIFAEAGAKMEDYLKLVRLDPQWRCFFDDGSHLDLAQNPDVMAKTLDAFAPGTNSGQRYRDFIDYSARLDGISQRHFFYKPIGGIGDMFEWKASFDPHMPTLRAKPVADQPHVSAGVMKVFAAYSRRYVRRHFHSFRILRSGLPPRDSARPLVIYLNHAAWWDPLVCLLLTREFFADRTSFAPIDAAMLERYGFFKHLGFFGIEPQTPRGARKFLRTTHAILASSGNAVWLTPQGRFLDVRERPLRLQDGLGARARHEPSAAFVPPAIEYSFWTEPRPEILVSFGEPIVPATEPSRTAIWKGRSYSPAPAT